MTHHSELINLIAETIKAERYIEVGVYNPDHNYNLINVQIKLSVDPDPNAKATFPGTSDQAFELFKNMGIKADVYLIDGLHEAVQVRKDIQNAWDCLNVGGVIIIHDSNPPTEETTCFPRGKQREWCGTVWNAICQLNVRPKFTVDFDYGCCVIRKVKENSNIKWNNEYFPWEFFDKNRKELLNLVTVDDALKIIKSW